MHFTEKEWVQWLSNLSKGWNPYLRTIQNLFDNEGSKLPGYAQELIKQHLQSLDTILNSIEAVVNIQRNDHLLELSTGPFDIWLQSILNKYGQDLKLKGGNLFIHQSGKAGNLYIDQKRWMFILDVLLSNAITYSNQKNPVVDISITFKEHTIALSIKDNGIGIFPEKIPHVFNPLYAEETHLSLYQPAHIRLYMALMHAKAMGGDIEVQSEKNVFTQFTWTTPLWDHLPSNSKFPHEVTNWINFIPEINYLHYPGDNPNISVQDHFIMIIGTEPKLSIWQNHLSEYKIEKANTGKLALLRAGTLQPDLLFITDSKLDDIELNALCHTLYTAEETKRIPLLVLSKTEQNYCDTWLPSKTSKEIVAKEIQKLIRFQSKQESSLKMTLQPRNVNSKESFLARFNSVVQANLDNPEFGVSIAADLLFISRSNLHKKLVEITGKQPSELIRTIRLEGAQNDIKQGHLSLTQIAEKYGFGGISQFSRAYKTHFGHKPIADK